MSNKQTATRNEKSVDSSKKNEQGSSHGKTAAKDHKDDANFMDDGNAAQSNLKTNRQSNQANVAGKEPSKNYTSKRK